MNLLNIVIMKKYILVLTTVMVVVMYTGSASGQTLWNKFNTSYGYIQLGPANNEWAHIYTDRSKFIFNKDVYSLVGGFASYVNTDLSLKTYLTTRITIKSNNGFVGIGTTSPTHKLHVAGNTRVDGELVLQHTTSNDWEYAMSLWVNRDLTKAFSVNRSDGGANLFTVWGNGVVNAKNIYAEEVEVRVDAMDVYWPDYVFKSEYKLRSLYDVDNFVKANSHLPDVPSEKEVMEKGVNLGEMDAILLKKVEELTLYAIKQQKEIDRLKQLIESEKSK